MSIVVLVSGTGTNLQAIINEGINVSLVICNKKDVKAISVAKDANIPVIVEVWDRKVSRQAYDLAIAHHIIKKRPSLIVLAGWMHILSATFLAHISAPIINLHPALPETFKGADAVKMAWDAFQRKEITITGAMVHHVVPEIDSGVVVAFATVQIEKTDTLETLRERVRTIEKPLLIRAIKMLLSPMRLLHSGKVRNVYSIGCGTLQMVATDRCSAFDRAICDIPHKGYYLNKMSEWWFIKTRNIVSNHYISTIGSSMFVKECRPFAIEVIVRGYITGSTSTSLWTHYSRNNCADTMYCGHLIPAGLKKNQKLPQNIVTPTTKGITDVPITCEQVLEMELMTQTQWEYVHDCALKLFKYGQDVADTLGLILVDTKYEFGLDIYGNILLIDELHTCDSSRYWLKDSYIPGEEPCKLDKDSIRDWIVERCDPYTVDILPIVPKDVIDRVSEVYREILEILSNESVTPPTYTIDHTAIAYEYLE